jgi:ATP-dependent DNA helicase RecG
MANVKKTAPPTPSSPVSVLPGVGPAKAAAYGKAGVRTLSDLIYHIPRAYENRGDVRLLSDARTDGGKTAVVLTVASVPSFRRLRGHMSVVKFKAFDDSGACELTFFNQPYLRDQFVTDSVWRFYGQVEARAGRGGVMRYSMSSPSYERWDGSGALPDFTAVYPLAEGLSQKQVAANVAEALKLCGGDVPDALPDEIRREYGLCTLDYALRNIHEPEDYPALARAKKRLVFDELFLFSMLLAGKRSRSRETGAFPCTKQNISPLLSLLPYELTGAQKRAVRDIAGDMKTDVPMSRIVIGDVGCGKTAVAACAVYIAVLSGRQAALMAPTEILAAQHYAELSPLFEKLGVRCALLTGATRAAEKKKIRDGLAAADPGERIDFIIGTHALLTGDVDFAALSLVITDEQHRFGVRQRSVLAGKAEHPHILTMSATPIPRSLALVLYGDLDITKIDEMPPGRQKVETRLANESMRDRVDQAVAKAVAAGGQVYIVCPSIDEDPGGGAAAGGEVGIGDITDDGIRERPPLKAASKYAEELAERLPGLRIALVHGRMKPSAKDAVMKDFAEGKTDVLVSTTVIEVGVNVPNATLMIVENAERFGLSQLHQLRGRVGRGSRRSECVLVSDDAGEGARARLTAMATTSDGFEIAEADLRNRGPGDFVGRSDGADIRQSGGLRFRFADLCGDAGLLAAASAAARRITEEDPELAAHPVLKQTLAGLSAGDTPAD